MTDYRCCDPHQTPEEIHAWTLFERRLGAYLSTMIDPGDTDVLRLTMPNVHQEGRPYTLTIRTERGGTVLEIAYGADDVYCDPGDLGDMPWRIADTLRDRFRLAAPQLISASASGPASIGLPILGLADDEAIREETRRGPCEAPAPVMPEGPDELLEVVLSHVRARHEAETEVDEDGDIPLVRHGVPAWVTVHEEAPALSMTAVAVPAVRSRRQADLELGILNRDHAWSRRVRLGDVVLQRATMPARLFEPRSFDEFVDDFFSRHRAARGDLNDRLCPLTGSES